MSDLNWLQILDWGSEELEDLRFVGYSYLKQGKYEIALTFFQALSVLDPSNTYDLQTLGAIHLQLNQNLEALGFLEKALKNEPHHLPTKLNRAKALYALGYNRQAEKEARELATADDEVIASQATALLMTHA